MDTDDNGVNRKRKHDFLTLTLAAAAGTSPPPPPPQQQQQQQPRIMMPPSETPPTLYQRRRPRRKPSRMPAAGKSATIPPPYPWADEGRATVRSLSYLRENGITAIHGDVQCRKCEQKFMMEFDLEQKFGEISTYVAEKKAGMRHRAPNMWRNPALPRCGFCNHEGSVKPVISDKKRSINWLFLFLGQMLGCCTLEQLKYFCKHTKNHRTGAKDRVLFLAYLGLCRQLDPNGPFDV